MIGGGSGCGDWGGVSTGDGSKMGRHKSYLKYVQNGGGRGQSHFWTVSKSKALFSDVFPRSENCISHLLKGLLPHGQSVNDLVCCLLVLVLVPGCQGLVQGSQDDDQGRGSWIMIRDGEESDL